MPTKPVQKFSAWSYSRLADWEACPLKAKLKHIDRLPEPDSPILARGSEVHKQAEEYSTARLCERPESLQYFAQEFEALRSIGSSLQTELQIALDANWRPVEWYAREAWLRVIVDCLFDDAAGRHVIDYKTGKIKPEQVAQLDLYAVAAFALPGAPERVIASFWYLDQGELIPREYGRAEAEALRAMWRKRSAPMLADTTFAARQGRACKWCHYRAGNGGPCRH